MTDTRLSLGNGNAAHHLATFRIHHKLAITGASNNDAIQPPTNPAIRPTELPHIITNPAIGSARTFAGSEAKGIGPKVGIMSGATAICAATVTAKT
jgi:hypothetical protein